jgi:hypothetical protein
MTVTYQVGAGGNLDIDFWVSHPWLCVISLILKVGPCSYRIPKDLHYEKTSNPPQELFPPLQKWMGGIHIASPMK